MPAFNYKNDYERYKKYYLSIEPVLNKPANRAYTAIILSFLTVSLFGWYAIRPTMQTIFTLKRQIRDRTDVDKKMEDKISALIEAQAAFDAMQGNLPLLAQALPAGSDPVRAFSQLAGLAKDTNVTLSGLTISQVPLENEPAPSTNKLPVPAKTADFTLTVSASGSYADVKNFITGVIDLRRIMQITGMTFSAKKETISAATASATPAPTGVSVQVELKLKVFYLTK